MLKPWNKGRVALLGDAIHAMMPNLGQGGCQALEDALVISEQLTSLSSRGEIEGALQGYRNRRLTRSAAVQVGKPHPPLAMHAPPPPLAHPDLAIPIRAASASAASTVASASAAVAPASASAASSPPRPPPPRRLRASRASPRTSSSAASTRRPSLASREASWSPRTSTTPAW